jgi:hypothetical protein
VKAITTNYILLIEPLVIEPLDHLLCHICLKVDLYLFSEIVDAIKIYPCSLLAFWLISPITSNPYISKSQGEVILNRGARDAFILSPYI